jgi:hypothetical protein
MLHGAFCHATSSDTFPTYLVDFPRKATFKVSRSYAGRELPLGQHGETAKQWTTYTLRIRKSDSNFTLIKEQVILYLQVFVRKRSFDHV